MREKENAEFGKMKRNLIIGTRKTHKYVENQKVSDYLVPYTSSGCIRHVPVLLSGMHYNKCAYCACCQQRTDAGPFNQEKPRQ